MCDWYKNNIEYAKKYQKEYRLKNSHIFKAKDQMYRARKLNASPKWITKEMRIKMTNIYYYCKLTSIYTGKKHSVDHIIPLQGKNVCGLHVPWNLQITDSSYNMSKSNNVDFKKLDNIGDIVIIDDSLVNIEDKIPLCKKVIRLNDGKIFNSITLASKEENCNVTSIHKVLNGNKLSINRNFYKYYEEVDNVEEEFNKKVLEFMNSKSSRKRVKCLRTGTIFDSTKDAALSFNVDTHSIRKWCASNKKLTYIF